MPIERATVNLPLASSVDEVVGNKTVEGVKDVVRVPVSSLAAQIESSRGRGYVTLGDLEADLDWPDGTEARVWGDPLIANRGIYQKSGVIGAGAWTRIGPIPETDLSHSMRVPDDEFINPFPDAATRAGTVVMFDGAGQPIPGPDASDIANAQSNAEQAALDRLAAEQARTDAEQAKDDAEQSAIDAANTVLANAAGTDFTPAGTMTSDNVQDALEELDSDIQGKADASALGAELPIGSTMLWMSDTTPSALWVVVKSDTQVFSRSTLQMLFDHYAPERTVVITNGSAIVTGIGSDQDLAAGMDVEGPEIPAGTTILSVDGPAQVTLSATATANGTTCRVFRYGNGDGSTTCNFPPFAGRYFRFGDPSAVINPDAAGAMGITQEDALQNVTGAFATGGEFRAGNAAFDDGAFTSATSASERNGGSGASDGTVVDFDASRVARTSSETRPKTIIGYVAVKVADGVDDPTQILAANVIQDLTDVISKADANEASIAAKEWTYLSRRALTTNTSEDFTGIGANAKRVDIIFNEATISGSAADALIQLGDAGGIETTGYASGSLRTITSAIATVGATDGIVLSRNNANDGLNGVVSLRKNDNGSNQWDATIHLGSVLGNDVVILGGGNKSLSDVLSQIRVTTVSGSDAIDGGSIDVRWSE